MSEPLEGEVVPPSGTGLHDSGGSGGGDAGGGDGRFGPGGLGGAGLGPGGRLRAGLDPARWRKFWLLPVVFGTLGVALGVLILIWPGHSVKALTILFGLYLLLAGVYRFASAVQLKGVDAVARMVALVLAALSVVFGLICLARPFNAATSLALVIGAFWVASGAITVFGAWQRGRAAAGRDQPGRSPGRAGGVFAIIVGVLILLFPGASLLVLAGILGCWLIFFGASAVATGLVARKLLARARDAALYWP